MKDPEEPIPEPTSSGYEVDAWGLTSGGEKIIESYGYSHGRANGAGVNGIINSYEL